MSLYAFRFEGREYRIEKLMLSEARLIQKVTGKTPVEFDEALGNADVECLAALIWIAQRRDNPSLAFEDVDGDVMSFEPILPDEEPRAEGNDQSGTHQTPAGA